MNAAPISLTTACYMETVPIEYFSNAMAFTCLLECLGVFGMPMLAGHIADSTKNMSVPVIFYEIHRTQLTQKSKVVHNTVLSTNKEQITFFKKKFTDN